MTGQAKDAHYHLHLLLNDGDKHYFRSNPLSTMMSQLTTPATGRCNSLRNQQKG